MKKLFTVIAVSLFLSVAFAKDIVVDVRTPQEFASGHTKSAINIDFKNDNFKTEILKLDKNAVYKLYCRSGNRSGQALKVMTDLGFKKLQNLGSLEDARKSLGE